MKKYQFALDQYALVSTADLDGKIIEVNDKFCEVSGFSRGELLNAPYQLINTNYHNKTFFKHLWHTINQGNVWHGEVKNFGWRKTSGIKDFEADTAQAFLSAILPQTDCTFQLYIDESHPFKEIRIQNFHHDSPMGNEWYTIVVRDALEEAA